MQYQIPTDFYKIEYYRMNKDDNDQKICFNHECPQPIKKIDNIDIVCLLDYTGCISENEKSITCDLVIKSKNCWSFLEGENIKEYKELFNETVFTLDDYRELTKLEYEDIKNIVNNIFKNIYFDKMIGKFLFNSKNEKEEIYAFVDEMIGDNPLIEKTYNDCCICYEKTMTKIDCCNGFICIQCWSNIKSKCKGGCKCNMICCPLCRNIINTNMSMES
jgi:hypothetical protein